MSTYPHVSGALCTCLCCPFACAAAGPLVGRHPSAATCHALSPPPATQLSITPPLPPRSTPPQVFVTPDGGLAVAAKSSLVKYNRVGTTAKDTRFIPDPSYKWPNRPGAGWVRSHGLMLASAE